MTQSKILRVLQDQTVERLGGEETIKVDIASLPQRTRTWRKQPRKNDSERIYFYRLNVVTLFFPLRERVEDIPELVEYFISRFKQGLSSSARDFSRSAQLFKSYNWPGNVRELENVLKKAFILCKSAVLTREDFPFLKDLESQSDLERFEKELSLL